MNRRKVLIDLVGLAAAAALPQAVRAEAAYPSRLVTVICPFPAGGAADVFTRMVAEHLAATWSQPFVVENQPGGGGIIGMTRVARATPDGYTLTLSSTGPLAVNETLYGEKLSYRTLRDFAPIYQLTITPNVLVVNPKRLPDVKTVADLIAHLRANPGKLSFGSAGIGTSQHLAGEYLQQITGTSMQHVPYRGTSLMLNDLIGGQIDLGFENTGPALPHIRSGALRALGFATAQRLPIDPDLPTIAETLPGFEATAWHGYLAPAATPRPIVDRLAKEMKAFANKPEVIRKCADLGAIVQTDSSPDAFARFIADETQRWRKVIEKANIKAG
ncbi:tripartite tricarboxylate transporter substrate binding protein [Rhodoplanes sp. TEM]|uniref:Tripartite tricarboxylate transporter substrate binding protein n=1 Tax=Rhodoplanes tepidamans TaxID=200616 RepID=A0ABT5J6L9_RHOTP|nr:MULTISPECIES: tripartite tricarboxylate transporter substrate binding protein [Rhodoplanes]MDC7785031.1 tripartite tricarboxylate transporter substrate binding protein [Rhodoplanes tepidamans]MDC7982505.1 tripartite tricarboxylate transporter substrate binding protein [Rhodoplanes sp. TEM]MDQ0356519.1 tripartite-type tricarboxylate transporter receptor subunit TctC [Rhodoplanes tepidamans]